jgi:hypothetical protein
MTKAQVKNKIDTTIYANGVGAITGPIMNEVASDLLNFADDMVSEEITNRDSAIAAAVIALQDGVPTTADTLMKLYNMVVASSKEVTVANIAARDAYDITELPTNVFVTDDGDGHWALYKATSTGVGATYVKISDPDLLNAALNASAIKTAYESNADTNAYTDDEKLKLAGIEAGATVQQPVDWNATIGALRILNKPTIPAAQVQTDWNATTGIGVILNKPTFGAVAFSNDYNDLSNKPTISGAPTGSNRQIQFNNSGAFGATLLYFEPTYGSLKTENPTNLASHGETNIITSSESGLIFGGIDNDVTSSLYSGMITAQHSGIRNSSLSLIGGGSSNYIENSDNSGIIGGYNSGINYSTYSFIGGGYINSIINSFSSSIGSGYANAIEQSDCSNIIGGSGSGILISSNSFIAASSVNQIDNSNISAIVGGGGSVISTSNNSFIGGGNGNIIQYTNNSFIGGGQQNLIDSGLDSTAIIGGVDNGYGYIHATQSNTTYVPDLVIKRRDNGDNGNYFIPGGNSDTNGVKGQITWAYDNGSGNAYIYVKVQSTSDGDGSDLWARQLMGVSW